MSFNLAARISDLEAITDSVFVQKANTVQPTFIGPATIKDDQNNVIANFASSGIVLNQPVTCTSLSAPITLQQKKYVDDIITALINGAPATLDTLKELATAIGNDPNLAAHLSTSIATLNNLINKSETNETNLVINNALNIGTSSGLSDIALMRNLNIIFTPSLNANGGALVFDHLRVLPTQGAYSLFRVDATPSPQISFNAPVLGGGYIYNKSDVDTLLSDIYKKSDVSALLTGKQEQLQISNSTIPNYVNLLIKKNNIPYICSLITPVSSLLQISTDPTNPELVILSDANIRTAINNKAEHSALQDLSSTLKTISDIIYGLNPLNSITGFLNAGSNNTYSKSYIDSNYYTRSVIDSTYATLNYVRSNFPQKFVITHKATDAGFFKFLYITVPTDTLSSGYTLRMDISIVKDKAALYGEQIHTVFLRVSDFQFQLRDGIPIKCDCVQYVMSRNISNPMTIIVEQDTTSNPGNHVFTLYGNLQYFVPNTISAGYDIGNCMVSVVSTIAYNWVGTSVSPSSLGGAQFQATQNKIIHSNDFANLSDYFAQSLIGDYMLTNTANNTFQTILKVASATTQPHQVKLLNTRPGSSAQYITTFSFPDNSLYNVQYFNSTPDILIWDDTNFYNTFYTKTEIINNYYLKSDINNTLALYYNKIQIENKLTGYYTIAQLNSKLSNTIVYKTDNINYIVAGDNTQDQLQFIYKGSNIMDLDAGALTVYTNVIANNVAQYYTINSGGTGQWFNLGTLHTTQEGRHFLIRITYSSGYDNSDSTKSNTATIHFKTSNHGPTTLKGFNNQPFYGDIIVYSYGPDKSIKARATQLNTDGTNFIISVYLPAYSGDALLELIGAVGVVNQTFDYNPVAGQTWGNNDNYIESLNDIFFTTSNRPKLSDIDGASSLFTLTATGSFTFNQTAIGQSIGMASAAGTTNILTGLSTSTETEIYVVSTTGKTYPIDNSSTISIRQDINTKYIYLDLKPSALSNYAPLNSPSFTGTVNMGALNIIKTQPWGTLQLSPPSDNQEVALGLYRYADKRVSNSGDAWLIGPQLWGNTGSFVIGTGNIAGCLTINTSGNVNIPYSLSINNVDILSKFNNYQPVGNYLTTSSTITSSKISDLSSVLAPYLLSSTAAQTYLTIAQNTSNLSTALAPYLLASTAASSYISASTVASQYQPIGNYLTSSSVIPSSRITDLSTTISAALAPYLTTSTAASTYQTIGNYLTTASTITSSKISDLSTTLSSYLTTSSAASIYQTVANMSSYLTTSVASATYQTILNVYASTGGTGYTRYPLLTTRPGFSGQYIGTLGWPSGSLFSAITSASTPDIINLVDDNFYSTFYTQSQSDTKYATKASPTFTGTATAPTINATTSLQVDGIDISTIYQTITRMQDYITWSNLSVALGLCAPKASPTFTGTVSGITAAMVGLGNVNNTSDANKPISTATQNALNLLAPLASPTFTGTVSGITAAMVGLGNVNNTSDANKPISTATQTALNLLAPKASPAFTGTVTYGGTDLDTLYKPWVIATIDGTTGNVSSSSGKATVSCTRTGAGSYTVSYTSTPTGAPSAVLLTLRNFTGFAQYSGSTGSSMTVSTRNTSATLTDATFSIVAYL